MKASQGARAVITRDRVLREARAIAFSSASHYRVNEAGELVLAEGAPPDALRAVSSLERRTETRYKGDERTVTHTIEILLWGKPGVFRVEPLSPRQAATKPRPGRAVAAKRRRRIASADH